MATKTKGKYLSTPLGIHRLTRNPYDDTEVFSSVDELLAYCNSGAAYRGQKVSVEFYHTTYDFIIKGLVSKTIPSGYDSISDRSVDLVTKYIPVLISNDFNITIDSSENMILLYHWNCSDKFTPYITVDPTSSLMRLMASNLNSTKNPLAFSILDLIDVFNIGSSSYKIKIRYTSNDQPLWGVDNPNVLLPDEKILTLSNNPTKQEQSTPYTKMVGTIDEVSQMQLNVLNGKFWIETDIEDIGFLPKSADGSHVGEIWLYAPDYIKALGRGYY